LIEIDSTAPGTPVIINAGAGNDEFHVNAPPSSSLTLIGNAPAEAPGDSLVLSGTGGSDGSYGPSAGTPGNGVILVDGQTIEFQGLEPIIASGFGTFRLVTPNADDDLVIDSPLVGHHRVAGSSDGVAFESLTFFDVATLIVDMAANNGATGDDRIALLGGDLSQSGVGAIEVIAAPGTASLSVEGGVTSLTAANGLRELRVSQQDTIVHVLESIRLESLFIGAGARVVLSAAGDHALQVARLEIEGGDDPLGTLDIGENGLIVDYVAGDPSPRELHWAQILHARNEHSPVLWTGHGLTSGAAAAEPNLIEVAIDEALDIFGSNGGVFFGVPIPANEKALLIRTETAMHVSGDTNGDKAVDLTDFGILKANFGRIGAARIEGDLDDDMIVTLSDFAILKENFGRNAIQAAPAVSLDDAMRNSTIDHAFAHWSTPDSDIWGNADLDDPLTAVVDIDWSW
jgi:hypothetical protein